MAVIVTCGGAISGFVYSVDRGRTWREYDGNPVVKHQGRDPRLLWHQPTKGWVMAVYDEADGKRQIAFHTSPDLKKWELASRIDGFFECPDLYELPVDGDENRKRWVLSAADSHYLIGTFDGREFRKESGKHPGNYGAGFYAAQTFSDEPDGKRIIIGWLQAAAPGMQFNQCMSFPCELSLRTTADGVRLHYQPVKQLSLLHDVSTSIPAQDLRVGDNPLGQVTCELLDVQLDLRPGEASELELSVRGVPIRYDVRKGELACRDRRAPAPLVDGRLKLQVLVDRTSIEIFAADGLVYMPLAAGPAAGDQSLGLIARGGTARVETGLVHTLKSAWGKADR